MSLKLVIVERYRLSLLSVFINYVYQLRNKALIKFLH